LFSEICGTETLKYQVQGKFEATAFDFKTQFSKTGCEIELRASHEFSTFNFIFESGFTVLLYLSFNSK
jgi:hypothetical protein